MICCGLAKQRFLIFMAPNCGPCTALLPEVARWRRGTFADDVTITIMSRGTVEENRRKFGRRDLAPVLVQDGQRISERYSAVGTPSAIVVRLDGRMAVQLPPGRKPSSS